MNFLNLLAHAGTIFSAIKTIESIIQKCVAEKRLPNGADDAQLLSAAESLLAAGVIVIPGLDIPSIAKALDDIKAQLPAA